jgi:hypothetical protein
LSLLTDPPWVVGDDTMAVWEHSRQGKALLSVRKEA